MKNLWLILPLTVIILFTLFNNIDPVVTDSPSYMSQNDLRPALYPLLYRLFGMNIIYLQSMLWLATGYLIFRETGKFGLIIYCSTIGLLFLSQKILTETVFVFLLTLAVVSKKDRGFLFLCLTMLIKPVMIFFIPIAYALYRPKIAYSVIGWFIVIVGLNAAFYVSGYLQDHHWTGIFPYVSNTVINCFGKTVGVEGFLVRITQAQTFSYVILAFCIIIYKHPLALLPLYLIVMSGLAPNQGDRLIIVIAPICIILFYHFVDSWKIPEIEPELNKQYPGGKWQ